MDALLAEVAPAEGDQHAVPVADRPDGQGQPGHRGGRVIARIPDRGERLPERLRGLLGQRGQQGLPVREVPVQGAAHHAGGPGDLIQARVRVAAELLAGRRQDAGVIGPGVAPPREPRR